MRTASLLKLGLSSILASACSRTEAPAPPNAAQPRPQVAALSQPPSATPAATAPATTASIPTATMPPTATPPSPTPPARHATALKVQRLVVARGVEGREPQGQDTLFAADEKRVFAFVELDNPERAPGDVRVQFVGPDGEVQPPIDLSVGDSPRWRTWAFTRRAHAPGTWRAVVRDERGRVLASTEFEVRA